jgi:hypothetical protein
MNTAFVTQLVLCVVLNDYRQLWDLVIVSIASADISDITNT